MIEGVLERFARAASAGLPLLASLMLSACGGDEEDTGVTYDDDVKVLFNRRCTTCHHAGNPINVDIENPYDAETGLVYTDNTWAEAYPGETDARNVVPGDPDSSFLMDKINGTLPAAPSGHGGQKMPMLVPSLTASEVATLRQWVTNGALNDAFFSNEVRPIFGSGESGALFFNGKCVFCHYENSPSPGLDLTNPFGPNGIVNVDAVYPTNLKRVLPGDPDQSLLILKVEATEASSDIGPPMPFAFDELTQTQINTVRQWIVEGAKP